MRRSAGKRWQGRREWTFRPTRTDPGWLGSAGVPGAETGRLADGIWAVLGAVGPGLVVLGEGKLASTDQAGRGRYTSRRRPVVGVVGRDEWWVFGLG